MELKRKLYRVCGKVEYNWKLHVLAESQEDAEKQAIGLVEEGNGLTKTINTPELYEDTQEIV